MMLLCGWRKRRNNKSSTTAKNRTQATNSSSSDENETNDNNAQPIAIANTTPVDAATASDTATIDTVKSNDDNSTESFNKSMFLFHLLQHLLFSFHSFRLFLFCHRLVLFVHFETIEQSYNNGKSKKKIEKNEV